jgi:hypothetical protein
MRLWSWVVDEYVLMRLACAGTFVPGGLTGRHEQPFDVRDDIEEGKEVDEKGSR